MKFKNNFSFKKPPEITNSILLSRRTLLSYAGVLFASSVLPVAIAQHIQPLTQTQNPTDFYTLSLFLTNKPHLDPTLANKAYEMLVKVDSGFPEKMQTLQQAIRQAQFKNIEEFKHSPLFTQAKFKEPALSIVSAWYLGYTGTPVEHQALDNTQFITYLQALMYQPTQDTLVIPSYVKWETNYWVLPPK